MDIDKHREISIDLVSDADRPPRIGDSVAIADKTSGIYLIQREAVSAMLS
jgi:hypothetical protein